MSTIDIDIRLLEEKIFRIDEKYESHMKELDRLGTERDILLQKLLLLKSDMDKKFNRVGGR